MMFILDRRVGFFVEYLFQEVDLVVDSHVFDKTLVDSYLLNDVIPQNGFSLELGQHVAEYLIALGFLSLSGVGVGRGEEVCEREEEEEESFEFKEGLWLFK